MTWSGRRSRVERTVVTRLLDVSCRNVSLPSSLFSLSLFLLREVVATKLQLSLFTQPIFSLQIFEFPTLLLMQNMPSFPEWQEITVENHSMHFSMQDLKGSCRKNYLIHHRQKRKLCEIFEKERRSLLSSRREVLFSERILSLSSLHFETTREGAAEKKTSTTTKKISLQRREREKPLWLRKEEEGKREEWREELKERRERGKHLSFVAFSSDSSSTAHVCLFSRDHRCRWSPFPVWFTSSTHPESYQLSSWILEASNPTRMARVAKAVGAGGELQFDMSLPSSHALHSHTNCISLTLDVHPL